nr:unnamed protein product [Spirometra erinaceieuropaei]
MILEAALENKVRKLSSPTLSKSDKLVHNQSVKELVEEQMRVLRRKVPFDTADVEPANVTTTAETILSQTEPADKKKDLIGHQVSSILMDHRPREVLLKSNVRG